MPQLQFPPSPLGAVVRHAQVDTHLATLVVCTCRGMYWVTIPTSTDANRALVAALAINHDERRIAEMRSRDVEVRVRPGDDLKELVAKIIRREGYFRAVLVQSRGFYVRPCANRCAREDIVTKFRYCIHLPGFQCGSCGDCVCRDTGIVVSIGTTMM